MTEPALPLELEKVRDYARRAIAPIKPSDANTKAEANFLFTAKRTEASQCLPPYYLVYLLFIDLLGFKNLGRFEKLAWSVPIDFEGIAFLVEHRKFGVGVFARDGEEEASKRIVLLIKKGVKAAHPFFEWMAEQAIRASKFNVVNNGSPLFGRYRYMRSLYDTALVDFRLAKAKHEAERQQREFPYWHRSSKIDSTGSRGELIAMYRYPWVALSEQVSWLALGAIDAFFSWTEHVFIHLAILQGKVTTGDEVAQLIGAEWNIKFKRALDVNDKAAKAHFDKMIAIRQQLRNFVAHGAFGKAGEAFHFHSKEGAVPVAFDSKKSKRQFSLTEKMGFDDTEALQAIEDFIVYLWDGEREPARIYIQESDLPSILTMTRDGKYAKAMKSIDAMNEFVDDQLQRQDAYTNMDW